MNSVEAEARSRRSSVTRPLGLVQHLQKTDTRIGFIPVLDLLVIALLLSLLFTRFVMLPGVQVDLPPSGMVMPHSQLPVAVLTIGHNGMIFFNGSVFEASSIEGGFEAYVEKSGEHGSVLLIKAESSMDLQAFLELCRQAKEAGFVQIQLAGRKPDTQVDTLPLGEVDLPSFGIPVL
jgi:biopolymer transport protein ExbD